VLSTTRVIEATGLGAKSEVEWSEGNRKKAGLVQGPEEIETIRARWTTLTNKRLAKLGIDARIDHRSLRDQGIDHEPTRHRGPAITGIQERGERSTVAHRWEQEASERLRLAKEAGQLEREHQQVRESVLDLSNDVAAAVRERDLQRSQNPSSLELREKARADWLEMRSNPDKSRGRDQDRGLAVGEDSGGGQAKDRSKSRDGPDDDFSL
jgi:hypothetical protein